MAKQTTVAPALHIADPPEVKQALALRAMLETFHASTVERSVLTPEDEAALDAMLTVAKDTTVSHDGIVLENEAERQTGRFIEAARAVETKKIGRETVTVPAIESPGYRRHLQAQGAALVASIDKQVAAIRAREAGKRNFMANQIRLIATALEVPGLHVIIETLVVYERESRTVPAREMHVFSDVLTSARRTLGAAIGLAIHRGSPRDLEGIVIHDVDQFLAAYDIAANTPTAKAAKAA